MDTILYTITKKESNITLSKNELMVGKNQNGTSDLRPDYGLQGTANDKLNELPYVG